MAMLMVVLAMMMTKMMLTMILTLIIMLLATFLYPDTGITAEAAELKARKTLKKTIPPCGDARED